ncbi:MULTISPECIES: hypothetical protein [unclassified Shewanella]|uniref:hypothetical protein n=1 Tax=unclassified Shewanella TaxID=196818 RepID=UPI0021D8CFCD|nr:MULTISPECIES: hypothetical protein [unclassified Shewanella]MCU8005754.1 hypothetical protein [Shewanella sp. SM96]MCU8060795.1 hypothetical protein [Shewanella sp. SM55]
MSDSAVFEIMAQFQLVITHEFTSEDLADAEGDIPTMHENFENEVQMEFSQWDVDIQLDNDVKITAEHQIGFSGYLKRCYKFEAEEFDNDELIDGCFETQLNDMKLEVINCCDMSLYEITLISYSWAGDEFVETILN